MAWALTDGTGALEAVQVAVERLEEHSTRELSRLGTGWDIERMKLDGKLDEARTRKGMICEFDRLMMIDGWIWASSDGAERLAVHMNLRPYELFRISVLGAFCRPTRCLPGVSGVTMSLAFSGWAGVAPSYPTMASICSSS